MSLFSNIPLRTAQVYGIYGFLGGGKTLTAVELAKDFLDNGHIVCTNIQLRGYLSQMNNYHYIEDVNNCDWWSLPCGAPRGSSSSLRCAVILDESAEFFNQFSSTSPIVLNFCSWLRHSSKRGQFVFMIVQSPDFLVKSVRLLCHNWIACTDLEQWRIPVLRLRLPLCSSLVLRRIFDKDGNLVSRGFCICDKFNIGQFYDTAQIINHLNATASASDYDPSLYIYQRLKFLLWLQIFFTIYAILRL